MLSQTTLVILGPEWGRVSNLYTYQRLKKKLFLFDLFACYFGLVGVGLPVPIIDILSRATEFIPQAHGNYIFGGLESGGHIG